MTDQAVIPEVAADPQTDELRAQTEAMVARFGNYNEGFTIDSNGLWEACAEALGEIKAQIKLIEARRAEMKAPILTQGRVIDKDFGDMKKPLEALKATIDKEIKAHHERQRKAAEAEARKAQEAEEKERQRLFDLSQKAEQRGDTKRAERHAERAMNVVAEPTKTVVPKSKGTSLSAVYKHKRDKTDPLAHVNMAALSDDYKLPDHTKIAKLVRTMGPEAEKVLGVGAVTITKEMETRSTSK